ncbi:efflux RND transporter permease subunit [Treponema zioleckii]|uniref:efflux RND transporter permease subunit n=1 Tax=Treponema zioleckii TaxID=331680 RepID=UPI00168B4BFC|nr:efflux RND transporter permease subunit [Treponema zioleckii]
MKNWFVAKKFVFFVLASITAIIVIGVSNVEIGVKSNSKHDVFSIEFEYYGMDSSKIEELITIPLEQKLLGLENLLELTSTTEYGKSVTTVYFKKTKK